VIRSTLAALLLLTAAPVSAQTVAFINGTVATGDGSEPVQGTVVIRDGKVVAAGPGVSVPADAQVVDANGKWVTPGIVAGFSGLGLTGVSGGAEGANDSRARNGPFSAAIDVVPAINPSYQPIAVNRADGVTRAIVTPDAAKSIFAGQGAVIDTGADMDPITKPRVFQFVELGEAGAEEAGGSRASAYILFRNALREARELQRFAGPTRAAGTPDGRDLPTVRNPNESRIYGPDARRSEDVLLTRFDAAALVPVLQGRQYLAIHVERASDILNVLELRQEFPNLKIIIVGATEGWLVANQLAKSGVPVVAAPVNDLPASFEQIAATQSNVGRMRAAGVNVSIGLIGDSHMLFNERQYAGNLVALQKIPGATGLSWGDAFAAITSGPAKAIGMGGQIGSLTPGAHGDVVVWSGDPLDPRTAAEAVYIDGVQQPLESHQSRLLERYRFLPRRDLPEAYRH
jgi:imidazolonepropionase-like amidohydrolase